MNFMDSFAIMVYDERMYFLVPIDVYIFNQRSSVWNKKISIGPFICEEPNIWLHSIVPCSRNGDILFLNAHGCRLYGVNPKTHTIKLLKDSSFPEQITYNCFNYSESLSFVKGMKPLSDKRYEGNFIFLHWETLELAPSYQYIWFSTCFLLRTCFFNYCAFYSEFFHLLRKFWNTTISQIYILDVQWDSS